MVLEDVSCNWWWLLPSFCIEIQVLFEKPSAPASVKKMAA